MMKILNYICTTIKSKKQFNMNTHPEHWYIEATENNYVELATWRQTVATSYLNSFMVGHLLLSEHPQDGSYYYGKDVGHLRCNSKFTHYQEITLEQFRQITNSKPMSKTIQIPRTLLNEYYEAATKEQKEYIVNHFKMDGTTTDEAIRGLHEKACGDWKPKIKANHPDCFPEENKHFDFSKCVNKCGHSGIVSESVADTLGLKRDFIMVRNSRNNDETHHRSFYLTPDYDWKLVQDGTEGGKPVMVLIPTKKVV